MRRCNLLLSALIFGAGTLAAPAQEDAKPRRVGFVAVGGNLLNVRPPVLAELARQGFVEGQNLIVDERVGPPERLPDLSRELAATQPDVVVVIGIAALGPAVEALGSTPVVAWLGSDPVALGLVNTTARPGGNLTGFLVLAAELDGKRLDILREAVPGARRLGVLALSPSRHGRSIAAIRDVATSIGVGLEVAYAPTTNHYAAAFSALRSAGAEGVVIAGSREFRHDVRVLASLAHDAGLPTVCEWAEMARLGCLLGYGAKFDDLPLRTGDYVARILRGASPAELPIEHPARLEFVVNMQVARGLNVDIPPGLLLRADEVIE
jgi:putative ABC transport system substrate-binding protein